MTATFTDTSQGFSGAATYLWSFGDGDTSTAANPTHTYTRTGQYTVSLQITDGAFTHVVSKTRYVAVGQARIIEYEYDDLYRLVEADYSSGEYFAYEYDAVGNRKTYTATITQTTIVTYDYDAADRLVRVGDVDYTWDELGRLGDDGTRQYAWDAAGRLISVTSGADTTLFGYNGDGDRLSKSVNGTLTTYTLDVAAGLPQVLAEHSGENATLYLYGLDLIGEQGAAWAYHLHDGLGSVRQLADGSGQVTLAQGARPFGAPLWQAGSGSSGFGFTGEQVDASTGLVFLRARYYDSGTGRFLSVDPWRGNIQRPGTLNRYVYVLDNPVNGTDPSGMRCLFFDKNCDEVVENTWDWATDRAQDVAVLPWRLIPGDFCLPGNLGCWGGEEYADWLENEYYPELPEYTEWWMTHPIQASGWLDEDDELKLLMYEDWFFQNGDVERRFDEHHPITQIWKRHFGVNMMRNRFYENGCVQPKPDNFSLRENDIPQLIDVELWGIILKSYGTVLWDTLWRTPDRVEDIDGTIGSYQVTITNNGDGTATFELSNRTSWKSLVYGMNIVPAPSRDNNPIGLGGNLFQKSTWTEQIPPGICDCP